MKPFAKRWSEKIAPALRNYWVRHQRTLLLFAIGLMAVLALLKLGTEFWRLLFDMGPNGAKDLRLRHEEVSRWFTGRPVYGDLPAAVYPPASYVMLWPLLGWLGFAPARWLWAVTSAGALGALSYFVARESGAETRLERVLVVLLVLSMNAMGVTIGNGQLILHLLPLLMAGLFLTYSMQYSRAENLLGAGLLLITLVKPNVSIPFLWIILFRPGSLRIAILISSGYAALTFFAALFQKTEPWTLLTEWMSRASETGEGGYADLYILLSEIGLKEWIFPVSLVLLMALGLWIYSHRDGDRWLLLGVTALFTRFWTYHRLYDNLLILFPMVSLFRTARQGPSVNGGDVMAGLLLVITTLIMLAPARLLIAPSPWDQMFKGIQVTLWLIVLIFLIHETWEEKRKRLGGYD